MPHPIDAPPAATMYAPALHMPHTKKFTRMLTAPSLAMLTDVRKVTVRRQVIDERSIVVNTNNPPSHRSSRSDGNGGLRGYPQAISHRMH